MSAGCGLFGDVVEQCVVVTSPETGETYRVRVDVAQPLTEDEQRDLALYMDALAEAARRRASGGT